jgi:hypothetical protein
MMNSVRWYGKGDVRVEQAPDPDPSTVITDRGRLEDAPALYKKFRDREDGCIKVVLNP